MASLEGLTVQSRRTFLKVAGGAAVTAASLSAFACGDDEDEGSGQQSKLEPKRGGVLLMTVGHAVSNEKLDPALQAAQNDWIYSSQVFEGLTNYDTDFNPVPVLATKWEVSDDVKSYTFHLREGVKFSDGSPFTAKDAAYTFKTVLDPELGSQLAGTLAPFLDPTGLHVVDDLTLRIDLKSPFAELPVLIGGVPGGIVKEGSRPITSVDKAIGTGAFKFKSFKPGQSWEMTRNEFYWDSKL
ncbi:MAG TPA: ABC transporter substrate-binding protein, partial [Baekduia sp.]|nr:ABC transporter substrate-binding protein [Baekduia sp.]